MSENIQKKPRQLEEEKSKWLVGRCKNLFRVFVEEILGLDNENFHDELDNDISQEFSKDSPGFQMIKRFFAVFTYPRDHGKAQSLDSKVLTPTGWKTIGELKIGDILYGADGKEICVTFLHPVEKMKLYRVTTRAGQSTLCNEEHLWRVLTPRNTHSSQIMPLKDFMNDYRTPRHDRRYPNRELKMECFRWIESPKPIQFSYKGLPVEPYTLGAWLGDGTSANGNITLHDDDAPEIIGKIPYKCRKINAKYRWNIDGLRPLLRSLDVTRNKHIPKNYLYSSVEQRIDLVKGMMDTDGSCDSSRAHFYNINESIIDDFAFLIRSLGGTGKKRKKNGKFNGKPYISYEFSFRTPFNPFHLSRKAKLYNFKRDYYRSPIKDISFSHEGLGRCITVSAKDGLYVTDDFLVTHNSKHLSIAYPLWRIAKDHNLRILSISRTANVAESFLAEIVSNIERNQRYKDWAKEIDPKKKGVIPRTKPNRKQTEDWSGKSITIERDDFGMKDPTICATGLFGQILSRRADIIILDDVVDQQNSMTELQRKKVIDWIETTVLPVLVPGGTLIYLGNTWHQDDVVSKFMNDPRFTVQKRQGAIIKEADRQDLWQKWGSIMLNITIPPKERFVLAMSFYQENKEIMDAGAEVLWKERYPYSRLYFERLLNPYVFARMYQCDPSNRPDQVIKDEWIERALKKGRHLRFQDQPHEKNYIAVSAAGMDLAISQEEMADDTCLLYLDLISQGYDGVEDGDYLIRQIHRGKFTPNEQRNKPKVAWMSHGMQTIRVESVGYQASLTIDLENEGVPVRSYHTGKEKFDPEIGVNSLAVAMENGKFVIPSDPTDPRTIILASKLANEMRAFPDGHTGDSLMALWFAYSEVRELVGERIAFPQGSVSLIKDPPPMKTPEQRVDMEKQADIEVVTAQLKERSNYDKMMGVFGKPK